MDINRPRTMLWLADRCFIAYTVLAIAAVCFAALQGLWLIVGVLAVLWILAAVVWSEWKHS